MCFPLFRHFRFGLLGAFMALSVSAFPPAPHYTIYGMVRDQVGQAITGEGAELVLLDGTRELARAPINGFISIDHNYSLNIRIDAARPQTDVYSRAAIPAAGLFSLVVEMNGALFYPIEISGSLVAGVGGERTALDLNLGSDSDNDTLPDTWEEWQLYQGGYFPDDTGWDLARIPCWNLCQ
jgi:hypothetical protein